MTETARKNRFGDVERALEDVRGSRLLINRLDEWLFQEIAPDLGRRVIEIGCGHGNFTELFLGGDLDTLWTTDLSDTSVNAVRDRFGGDSRFHASVYDVCDPVPPEIRDLHADTVFSLNVLEHIEDDVQALRNMSRMLVSGGKAIIIIPAHEWAYGSMDSSIGHFRRYTRYSIREKMEGCGFAVERQFYLNALGLLGWFLNGRVLKKEVPPTGQLRLFNRLVPLLKAAERTIRPPVGISVVTVARVKAGGL